MKDPLNINPPNESKLNVISGCLLVDGLPFVVDYPDESIVGVNNNKMVTIGRGNVQSEWSHDQIEGYYA